MLAFITAVAASTLIEFEVVLAPEEQSHVITARVRDDLAPIGAARLVELVNDGHYDNCAFFRVLRGFVAQFGISGNSTRQAIWRPRSIRDEGRVAGSNTRGMITFAHAGPDTRSTQLFINLGNNMGLDKQNFPPVAEIVDGLRWIDQIHVTGEGAPKGAGPNQGQLQRNGDAYLRSNFPSLSRIRRARVVPRPVAPRKSHDSLWLLGLLFFGLCVAAWIYLSQTQRAISQQTTTLFDVEASLTSAVVVPNKES